MHLILINFFKFQNNINVKILPTNIDPCNINITHKLIKITDLSSNYILFISVHRPVPSDDVIRSLVTCDGVQLTSAVLEVKRQAFRFVETLPRTLCHNVEVMMVLSHVTCQQDIAGELEFPGADVCRCNKVVLYPNQNQTE